MTKSTEVGLRGDLQKINRNRKIGAKLRPPYPRVHVLHGRAREQRGQPEPGVVGGAPRGQAARGRRDGRGLGGRDRGRRARVFQRRRQVR